MERVKGIEPSQPAWKAGALPLSYTRLWWKGQDLNLCRLTSSDLQSDAFNHSATLPSDWLLTRKLLFFKQKVNALFKLTK